MATPFKMKGPSLYNSPMKQKNHPVTPPTNEQSKKDKGTIKKTGDFARLQHGRWDRPELQANTKKVWKGVLKQGVREGKNLIKNIFKPVEYPGGYSKQKKHTERGQSKSSASGRKTKK